MPPLIELIDAFNPKLVVLAGFMRILSADFVRHYDGPPAQYPSFAAAQIQRVTHSSASAGSRGHRARLLRALRHRGTRWRTTGRTGCNTGRVARLAAESGAAGPCSGTPDLPDGRPLVCRRPVIARRAWCFTGWTVTRGQRPLDSNLGDFMRRALLFACALLALPFAQAADLQPFSASYTADWKQLPMSGTAERSLTKDANGVVDLELQGFDDDRQPDRRKHADRRQGHPAAAVTTTSHAAAWARPRKPTWTSTGRPRRSPAPKGATRSTLPLQSRHGRQIRPTNWRCSTTWPPAKKA